MTRLYRLSVFLFLFFATAVSSVQAQFVSQIAARQEGNAITISYDLVRPDGDDKRKHTITAFYSTDGGVTFKPLQFASGDLGKNVIPGLSKSIRWDVLQQFPNGLEGNIQYRIDAKPQGLGKKFWMIAGGSLAAAAGAGVFALTSGSGSSSGDFSTPPTRPN